MPSEGAKECVRIAVSDNERGGFRGKREEEGGIKTGNALWQQQAKPHRTGIYENALGVCWAMQRIGKDPLSRNRCLRTCTCDGSSLPPVVSIAPQKHHIPTFRHPHTRNDSSAKR